MTLPLSHNPRIGPPQVADARGVPALPPLQGRDTYSELPLSDGAPPERRIAGEVQPGAVSQASWRRAAQLFLTHPGEALVALLLVTWIIWIDDLFKLLVGWTS